MPVGQASLPNRKPVQLRSLEIRENLPRNSRFRSRSWKNVCASVSRLFVCLFVYVRVRVRFTCTVTCNTAVKTKTCACVLSRIICELVCSCFALFVVSPLLFVLAFSFSFIRAVGKFVCFSWLGIPLAFLTLSAFHHFGCRCCVCAFKVPLWCYLYCTGVHTGVPVFEFLFLFCLTCVFIIVTCSLLCILFH